MASWLLLTAAAIAFALATAHSYLGERYILRRLFRRPLPPLFGSDRFTKRTLRFVWHVLTVAWFGMAALMVAYAWMPLDAGAILALRFISGTLFATGVVTIVISEGRHVSWIAEFIMAALIWTATLP